MHEPHAFPRKLSLIALAGSEGLDVAHEDLCRACHGRIGRQTVLFMISE